MKVGVIIFIVLLCGVVLVELVSLAKTLSQKVKAKKKAKEKAQEVADVPVLDNIQDVPKEENQDK